MKKFICFVLGLIIGASGVYLLGDSLRDKGISDVVSEIQEAFSDSKAGNFLEDIIYKESEDDEKYEAEYESNDGDEPEKEDVIVITSHLNFESWFSEDIDFPLPPEELLDPDMGGDDFVYDMQDNGKGVLINYYAVGMSQKRATVFVTSDHGENWKVVQRQMHFLGGCLNVTYNGDTIIIIHTDSINVDTKIHISHDNGKTFNTETVDPLKISQIIGGAPESNMSAFPVFLSKDTEKSTVLCAWFVSSGWSPGSKLLLISEHDATTFEITREFYRNKTAVAEELYCSD